MPSPSQGLERGAGPGCPACGRSLGDSLSPGEGSQSGVPRGSAQAHRAPSAPPLPGLPGAQHSPPSRP